MESKMLENYLHKSRNAVLEIFGSQNIAELVETNPERTLFKKGKDGTISRDDSAYFFPEKVHSFYLDFCSVIPESESFDSNTTLLGESKSSIQHDLVSGGSAEVGVLHETSWCDVKQVVKRGYVRMLYQTNEGGPVSEAYVLCDINTGIFSTTRSEQVIKPTRFDAPLELMMEARYLNRVEVSLGVRK